MLMIIEILNQQLGDEVTLLSSRKEITMPDVSTKGSQAIITKRTIIPEKFESDIAALRKYLLENGGTELKPGINISISLQELLQIAPRQRRRSDAYQSLVRYLREEMRISLIINSQKKQKNEKH